MSDRTLIQKLKAAIDSEKNSSIKKDNLTDVASQISNQPSTSQPQSSNASDNSNNQPQNLGNNQVVGADGTVIDLNIDQQNTIKK